ncbi:carbonic anhydrase-related protein 10 [Caerostris extrusa]|uniref:Carbonic anhydrase-related protein 10 n=1 Tax=Caerostris extrusa TaxID=172846 RepID=A0AAV4RX08_CAEEX|nr:carbonic anhydrase-related protein 10 [Caerostris extrusa]
MPDIASNALNLNAEGSNGEDDNECEKKSVSNTSSSPDLRLITSNVGKILYKRRYTRIKEIQIFGLLPTTGNHFMTYEGSTTTPGCHETVTWIVLNKPAYMTKTEIERGMGTGDILIFTPLTRVIENPPVNAISRHCKIGKEGYKRQLQ